MARPVEFGALKRQLLNRKGDAVAITAALRGAGGYGKTTLAKALAHDADIQDAYFDGILWVELGENPRNLLSIVSDLIESLSGERPGLETINIASAKLGQSLGDRRILLVVDDVWRQQDLRPFMQGGTSTTRLITTRNDSTLPANAVRQSVDAMRGSEALELIENGLPAALAQRRELTALAAHLGEWPLLLKLVNGFLRDRVLQLKQSLPSAIVAANKRLDEKGFIAFDARNETERTKAVALTIGVSLELLDPRGRERFAELGIFAEDAHVPIGIVEHLWRDHLDPIETENLLSELYGLSLLLGLDLERFTLQLHDTIRHFLRAQTGTEGIVRQQRRLLQALDEIRASDQDSSSQHYYYLHLPYHLAEANERQKLDSLLLDPGWLTAKLAATANTAALIADYDHYALGEPQQVIGRTLRLTAHICARDQHQLIPQLLGRLMTNEIVVATGFLDAARQCLRPPAILTEHPSLTPPGAEAARIEGHSNWVNALCVLPDGRLVSGAGDHTIRLWDVARGAEVFRLDYVGADALCMLPDGRLASSWYGGTIWLWDVARGDDMTAPAYLQGHSRAVNVLCVLPDGRLASGSDDTTIRLWDVTRGAEVGRLEGDSHSVTRAVTALCVLPDGRLAASGSWDGTIRLWDVTRGGDMTAPARLEGHSGRVTALCVLPDGRLASGSEDTTIRLWDVTRGGDMTAPARLEGHSGRVTALCVLPDGRLASGSDDGTIRLWDVARGAEAARLEGHSGRVRALCVLPGDRLASCAGSGDDGTIRLWDVARGGDMTAPARLKGHFRAVTALCVLPDGRLGSCAGDNTIRLWDVARGAEVGRLAHLGWHSHSVTALCVLPDGRLASGDDGTIRLWDVARGAEVRRLEGRHSHSVTALCVLPDGRLAASGDYDGTIQLWDVARGAEVGRLAHLGGHSHSVTALCALPDGRLAASGGYDGTIRLWDVARGAEVGRLKGHSHSVTALCALPDGRLASGDYDGTIQLWDVVRGGDMTAPARLEGHSHSVTRAVTALCVLPDGRLASGSRDGTVRLWDVALQQEISRLEVDAPIMCLTALRSYSRLVAGDQLGRLHWLQLIDSPDA